MLNKKMFDKEYQTQMRKEYLFLLNRGFNPTYIYKGDGVNVATTYKYKKTPELFAALSFFYEEEQNEKKFNEMTQFLEKNKNNKFDDETKKLIENIVAKTFTKYCPVEKTNG